MLGFSWTVAEGGKTSQNWDRGSNLVQICEKSMIHLMWTKLVNNKFHFMSIISFWWCSGLLQSFTFTSQWIIIGHCCCKHLREAFTGERSMATWAIESTEFKSYLRCDLWGHLEATKASKAMKVASRSNMLMDSRVIEVVGLKSEPLFIALSLTSL